MTESTRLLRDLVALPSVNPMGRPPGPECLEHRVTAYLENYFRELGVPYERQTVAPQRDNIVARCDRPGARRTLMLEVHQDTVPIEGMTIPPFAATIEGGRLYGRGACDVKGGMASMLAAFARVVREKPANACNVIMACTVDEEYTFRGVLELAKVGPRADAAIVAEPTGLKIVHAHKGAVRWFIEAHGRSCHSSSPQLGASAIYRMGHLLVAIEKYAEQLRQKPLDPLLGPATLSVGRIEGGISVNTVPDRCRIEIDRRVVQGEDPMDGPKDLLRYLREEAKIDFPFTSEPPWMGKRALGPKGSEDLVARLGGVLDTVRGSHEVMAVPYGTDASTLSAAGIPSVVFGPGDIAKAHTCDESVPLDEVEQASDVLYRLICAG